MEVIDVCVYIMLISIILMIITGALAAVTGFMIKGINKAFLFSILTLIVSTVIKELLRGTLGNKLEIKFMIGNMDLSIIPIMGLIFVLVLTIATFTPKRK